MTAEAQALYERADFMLVVGSRLRGNETRNNAMRLPRLLAQADAEPTQAGRNYPVDLFVAGDARLVLEGLLARLPAGLATDVAFLAEIAPAKAAGEAALRRVLGPYAAMADALSARVLAGRHPWVRDVTISNSTFGNRYVKLAAPHLGVHALGGGIGQGIAMGIGAALAGAGRAICLVGDGGAQLMIGELATAHGSRRPRHLRADERPRLWRHPQHPGCAIWRPARLLEHPDPGFLAGRRQHRPAAPPRRARSRISTPRWTPRWPRIGPNMIEIDMLAIGPFAESFAGPPAGAAGSVR